MGANGRKHEPWLIPRTTRHVWVLREQRWLVPYQGYVVGWRRHSYRWSALVTYVAVDDPERPLVQMWLPRERLLPVRSRPEDLLNNPFPDLLYRK
ncbi:hypothetical protein GCM10023350_13100 [Nocardioides endophyticus]|uniref:DUF1653 domain-containing protein n=1 Tax=Nocardioides endophyticus TaxID=1353775 RepID=A0ABP8YK64_9ACTN